METLFMKTLKKNSLEENIKLFEESNEAYYNDGTSELTDEEYDTLLEYIKSKKPNFKVPTRAKVKKVSERVKLPLWMGSMNKFYPKDEAAIKRWINKNKCNEYCIEEKLDGNSALLIFDSLGEIKMYTTGNGEEGKDISDLAPYLNFPKNIKNLVVRGELIIQKKIFDTKIKILVTDDSRRYSNARNTVAGLITKKDKDIIRHVDFVAFEIIEKPEQTPQYQLKRLASLKFIIPVNEIINSHDLTIENLEKKLERFKAKSKYEIDGIIIQSNTNYVRNVKDNPSYAFAFKVQESGYETKVTHVEWNLSKQSYLKPIVHFEPIQMPDCIVSKATGINGKFIFENKIGPGAIIEVVRAGSVIPKIINIIKPAKEPSMPQDVEWEWNETQVDIMTNENQHESCIKLIYSFFHKIGAKFVAEQSIKKMYAYGLDTLIKIIHADIETLMEIDTFKKDSATRIHNSIRQSLLNIRIEKLLGASNILGIGIGERKVSTLLEKMPNIFEIYKKMPPKVLAISIEGIDGFADKTSLTIAIQIPWALKFLQILEPYTNSLKNFQNERKNKSTVKGKLSGQIIVFSGFRDSELEKVIIKNGGQVGGDVTKSTTLLIVSSYDEEPTGKVKKAEKYSIKIISKDEFNKNY